MIRKKVVLTGMWVDDERVEKLKQYILDEYPQADIKWLTQLPLPEEKIIEECREAEVLVAGHQEMTDKAYKELNLKAYCALSTGFNAANPDAATCNGILVTNVPDYCVDEVSVHTLMLMLACVRGINKLIPYVKGGNWGIEPIKPITRFEGCTIGLLGFGRIPRKVAKKLSGFDVNIIANDPYVKQDEADQYRVEMVSFEELVEKSDILSIHAPLLPTTKYIINEEVFKRMKPTSYIINTSRGPLIDQEALYLALSEGWIRGAGLDVLENEPPKEEDRKIIDLPNVIVSGHSGFYSEEALEDQLKLVSQEVGRVLRGEMPKNVVNKEVLNKIDWIKK
ncbi:MAG: C-terminal binding protein [Clostridiales bacterium]|nr:C-terminal binding protein [Clostridiales bacterium]